jgi:hypothetical protein
MELLASAALCSCSNLSWCATFKEDSTISLIDVKEGTEGIETDSIADTSMLALYYSPLPKNWPASLWLLQVIVLKFITAPVIALFVG